MAALRLLIEGAVYLAAFAAFLTAPPVRAYAAKLPRPHRWFFGCFLVLLLAGHLVNKPRLTFPFSSWAMYGKPESADTLVFYRYEGRDEAGKAVELDALKLLAPIPRDGVVTRITSLAKQVASARDDATRRPAMEGLITLLRTVGASHNRKNPDRAVSSVGLIRCTLDLRQGRSGQIRQEPLLRVEL